MLAKVRHNRRLLLEQLEEREVPSIDLGPIINPANGHTYYRLAQTTFAAAEAEAVGLGGHLVTINDAAENTWVYSTFHTSAASERLLIGLHDAGQNRVFVWVSGEPVTYTNWWPGEPNNFLGQNEQYVELDREMWNDIAFPEFTGRSVQPVVEVPTTPADIHMISAQLQSGNTVQFTYETTGNPGAFDVGLYRSTDGITYNPADLIDTQRVTPSPTNPQAPGTFTLTNPWNPDPDKPFLLVVADPLNAIDETDEDNNSQAFQLTDLAIQDATTTDLSTLNVTYAVSNTSSRAFVMRAYLSSDAVFDPATSGGTDVPIQGGQVGISADADREVGEHPLTIVLPQRAPIDASHRFIIVVADPDSAVFEANEANNTIFVIPLFSKDQHAGFDTSGQLDLTSKEKRFVAPIGARISRGTADFAMLTSIQGIWGQNGRTFSIPDPAPYAGDDWMVQGSLILPVVRFTAIIDQALADGRLDGAGQISITEAFDEENDHSNNSLHYEARAIDFDAEETPNGLGRLSGLAFLAGFDWVHYEPTKSKQTGITTYHLHVSQEPSFTASFDAATISDALDWGSQNGLIPSSKLYNKLNDLITNGNKKSVGKFIGQLKAANKTEITEAFKVLLTYNAKKLEGSL